MIRVIYQHYCDICADQHGAEVFDIGTGGVFPQPAQQRAFNNVTLCPVCADLAVPAMNDALKDRRKVQEH